MLDRKLNFSKECESEFKQLFDAHPSLMDSVSQEVTERSQKLNEHLGNDSPWSEDQKALDTAMARPMDQIGRPEFEENYQRYSNFMGRTQKRVASSFWNKEFSKLAQDNSELPISRELLLQTWRKNLIQEEFSWQEQETGKSQEELDKDLNQSLEQFEELLKSTQGSGLDMGQFFDCSEGKMEQGDFEEIKKCVELIANDDKVRDICELIGKTCEASQSTEQPQPYSTNATGKEEGKQVKEEIVGLELSQNIGSVLPTELALLLDPEIEPLFYLKYAESELMSYEKSSFQSSPIEVDEEHKAEVEDGKGPMVVCIDTSGSMQGAPEKIAKAVALYMATMAKKEKRNCYLINFSSSIETLDLSKSTRELIPFLQESFHGGTDVEPAILHGAELMGKDNYKNADLLVISDELVSHLAQKCQNKLKALKTEGNSFYELCLDKYSCDKNRSYFDRTWIYEPIQKVISELTISNKEEASKPAKSHK